MSNRANNFSTFLQTVNSGKAEPRGAGGGFEHEAAAKAFLSFLAGRKVAAVQELEQAMSLTSEQTEEVLAYLQKNSLVARSGDMVELTGFGRDALGMFSVS